MKIKEEKKKRQSVRNSKSEEVEEQPSITEQNKLKQKQLPSHSDSDSVSDPDYGSPYVSDSELSEWSGMLHFPNGVAADPFLGAKMFCQICICSRPSIPFKRTVLECCAPSQHPRVPERTEIRLGIPSKGRMSSDTLDLLKDCQLSVKQVNTRQYVARIPQLANLEVWLLRPKDIVRKLVSGDLDLGIVGFDTVSEYGQGNDNLVLVHDGLEYGNCRLSLAIPKYGIFEDINSLEELAQMPQWTAEKPLRVATGFTYIGPKFMKENGLKYVTFSTADGALEAAPAMGIADAILDLVSSGTTLKENNLKEIEGGIVLESQAVLVANWKALIQRKGALDITREILERLEAHLRAVGQFTVTANMRGSSAEEVAERILSQPSLSGLQGPTVSPVFCKRDGKVASDYFAIVICVPKKALYKSVQQLRAVGGSGVLVSPLTYIFDKETPRWRELLLELGL